MSDEFLTKSAVSVTEMARMVGLSRARFYQLQKQGIFPEPDREPNTGRPFYTEEKQQQCLEVRRRNCGVNGRTILFYSRRKDFVPNKKAKGMKPPNDKKKNIAALLDGLNSLGWTTATAAEIDSLTKDLFPTGTEGIDQGEVLKKVFLEIRRRNSSDNVG